MANPKARVSGEGLVKMVRVLLVRPAGENGSSGMRRSCGTGGRAAEEERPAGIRVCRLGGAGTG